MTLNRKFIFDEVKRLRGGKPFGKAEIASLDLAIDKALGLAPAVVANPLLTARVLIEIISHEAIVQEAYLDSVGVWSWSVGLTAGAGIDVQQYKDNPQSLDVCLGAFVNRLQQQYVPEVLKAFHDFPLTEEQFAAALSFHFNTGAIGRADWVQQVRYGHREAAKAAFMNWRKPKEIIPRREKERDLFFDGEWSNDGKSLVIPVRKPSYRPDFARAKRVDIKAIIEELLP